VTEVLRVIIEQKMTFLKTVDHFGPKFQVEGDVPHQPIRKLDASTFHTL